MRASCVPASAPALLRHLCVPEGSACRGRLPLYIGHRIPEPAGASSPESRTGRICGCSELGGQPDLSDEALRPQGRSQLGREHLGGNHAIGVGGLGSGKLWPSRPGPARVRVGTGRQGWLGAVRAGRSVRARERGCQRGYCVGVASARLGDHRRGGRAPDPFVPAARLRVRFWRRPRGGACGRHQHHHPVAAELDAHVALPSVPSRFHASSSTCSSAGEAWSATSRPRRTGQLQRGGGAMEPRAQVVPESGPLALGHQHQIEQVVAVVGPGASGRLGPSSGMFIASTMRYSPVRSAPSSVTRRRIGGQLLGDPAEQLEARGRSHAR